MRNHYLSRRSLAKQMVAGSAALGIMGLPPARAQTPVALDVPTVDVPVPLTIAEGLVVERVYDRIFTPARAWVIDVRNTTDQTWAAPDLTMSFFDANGNILGEDHPFKMLEIMHPGELVPYKAEFFEFHPSDAEWATIGFLTRSPWPAEPYYTDAVLEIRDTVEESKGEAWKVTGKVANISDVALTNVMVTAVIRSNAGEFLGNAWTMIITPIPPGNWAQFVCDVGYSSIVPYDPFAVASDASEFDVQLMATTRLG